MLRTLISVSNKTDIISFAKSLSRYNFPIISTGGTYDILSRSDINVDKVSNITGYPEILGGRVKTLHPNIFGGLLHDKDLDDIDTKRLLLQKKKASILPINMLVCNLYPFEQIVFNPNHTENDAIENIDIGGHSMIRASAKNHKNVFTLVDPNDYEYILDILGKYESTNDLMNMTSSLRYDLAKKAFNYITDYDLNISNYYNSIK